MLAGFPTSLSTTQSTQASQGKSTDQAFAGAMQGVENAKSGGQAVAVGLVGTLLPEMRTREFEEVMLAVRRNDPSMLDSRVQEGAYEVIKTLQEAGIPVDNSGRAHVFEDYTTLDVFARLIADYPFAPNEGGGFPTYHPPTDIGPRLKEHFSPAFVDRMLALAENYEDRTRRDSSI